DARAGAALEDDPLLADPRQDRVHRFVDGEDEAGGALPVLPRADVEPDRRVERHLLVHEQVRELRLEGLGLARIGEVALLVAPPADLLDDPVEQLADAGLAPRRAQLAAEVLRRDDVGRKLRPGLRDLDVVLLEDLLAALALDPRGAPLPGHLVVGVDPRTGEVTPQREAGAGVLRGSVDRLGGHQSVPSCRVAVSVRPPWRARSRRRRPCSGRPSIVSNICSSSDACPRASGGSRSSLASSSPNSSTSENWR